MKDVFYNPLRAKEEELIKKEAITENERRAAFFKRLSKDKQFKKYVIDEIIEFEIQQNKDLSGSLTSFISATAEEVKSIMVGKSAALKTSENIRNKIVAQF